MKEQKEMKERATELARTEEKPFTAFTPFGFMRRFATDMERLFEESEGLRFPSPFGKGFLPFTREFEFVPEIEVLRRTEDFVVRVDLPGLKRDDVKIELTNDLLTISGERKEEKKEEREGYYRSERSYGSFFRQIPLPEGAKTDTAKAEFTDGVLVVTMQASAREPQKRILEIKQGEEVKAKGAATR